MKKLISRGVSWPMITGFLIACCVLFSALLHDNTAQAATAGTDKDDYLYLAQLAAAEDDTDTALRCLKKYYAENGQTPDGTLMNARVMVLRGDFIGAQLLYEKLVDAGQDAYLSKTDKTVLKACEEGCGFSALRAASVLSEVSIILDNDEDPEVYGYTDEIIEACELIAGGELDYASDIREVLAKETREKKRSADRYDHLTDAMELIPVVRTGYEAYTEDLSHDEEETGNALRDLKRIYKKSPEIFQVYDIDEIYVKSLVMNGELRELVEYADQSGSQLAFVTVAQLLYDNLLTEKDLPGDFVRVTAAQRKEVYNHCREIYQNEKRKKERDSGEMRLMEKQLEALENYVKNPAIAELSGRIDPETVPLDERSPLYLGSAAFQYGAGNTDRADADLKKALETAPYSKDDNLTDLCDGVSKAIYGDDKTASINDLKDVGQQLEEAYKRAVPNMNGSDPVTQEIKMNNGHRDSSSKNRAEEQKTEDDDDDFWDTGDEEEQEEVEDESWPEQEEPEETDAVDELVTQGTTYVSKQKAMMNIGSVDAGKFPEVSFMVQSTTPLDEKKAALTLEDCGYGIEDFQVEKKSYDLCRIYMVCDKSGSMEGSTDALQTAVHNFASSISDRERIGLIGFSDHVEFSSGLVADGSELNSYIRQLEADGGTDIASGAFAAVDALSGGSDSFNVIVLMTDGEDSSFTAERMSELRSRCDAGNIVLYVIGMGAGTNPSYLSDIADAGNGRFMYSYSVAAISALYDFIHAQMENNYQITFTARERHSTERHLTLTDTAEGLAVSKDYRVDADDLDGEDEEEKEMELYGFRDTRICKEDTSVPAAITGVQFDKEMKCMVSLSSGSYQCYLKGTWVDEGTFTVEIPAEIPYGKYKAKTSVETRSVTQVIEIAPDDEHILKYGAYVFSADKIVRKDKTVKLSGNVTLGEYAHFKGDVVLKGDLEKDLSIKLADDSGFSVAFKKPLTGLFSCIYDKSASFLPTGEITIYNDQRHLYALDEYKVDEYMVRSLPRLSLLIMKSPGYALYPHQLWITAGEVNFNFPGAEWLLSGLNIEGFAFETNFVATVSEEGMFAKGKLELGVDNGLFQFGKRPFGLSGFAIEYDTKEGNYTLDLAVSMALKGKPDPFDNGNTLNLHFGFTDNGFDAISIRYENSEAYVLIPAKLAWNNIGIGVSNLSRISSIGNLMGELYKTTLSGYADFEIFKCPSKINNFLKWLFNLEDDLTVLTLADTTISFGLEDLAMSLETNAKLFGQFDFGRAKCELGAYKYSDYLLGLDEWEAAGFRMSAAVGPEFHSSSLDLVCQGGAEIGLNERTTFMKSIGHAEINLDCIKSYSADFDGITELALTYDEGLQNVRFYLIIKRTSFSANESAGFKFSIGGWTDSSIEYY